MANNINARIYKNPLCALKYAKKVRGNVTKVWHTKNHSDMGQDILDKFGHVHYVVYSGDYKCI